MAVNIKCTGPDCSLCRLAGPPREIVMIPLLDSVTLLPTGGHVQMPRDKAEQAGLLKPGSRVGGLVLSPEETS